MVSSITVNDNTGTEWSGLKSAFFPCHTHIIYILLANFYGKYRVWLHSMTKL